MAVFNNGVIVSSTKDILKRANTVEEDFITLDCDMNVIYTIDSQRFQISNELISTNRKDLQYEL
jgi:hypothetical protein